MVEEQELARMFLVENQPFKKLGVLGDYTSKMRGFYQHHPKVVIG